MARHPPHPTVSLPSDPPDWGDGDCRERKRELSSEEASELESRFAEPIWAMVEQLRPHSKRWKYHVGTTIARNPEAKRLYDEIMAKAATTYKELVSEGVDIEDALGILPTVITDGLYDGPAFEPDFHMEVSDELANGPREELLKVFNTAMQREAIDAYIQHNDKRPLARLLSSEHPLEVETRLLIGMIFSGELNHQGGRPKKGAEKNLDTESAKLRRATDAAFKSLPLLRKALRAAYPKQKRGEIGKRARYMAIKKYSISEAMIERYRNLPKSRRLPEK